MLAQSFLISCPIQRFRASPLSAKLLVQAPGLASFFRLFSQSHAFFKQEKKKPRRFAPSLEQQKVVKLCLTQNVVVSARPGSGKTATAEAIVAAYPDKRVVTLTYSKTLQQETQKRLKKYRKTSKPEVFTFHGMATKLFGEVVKNDHTLRLLRTMASEANKLPQWHFNPFDIIVVDEAQDCTELLFWLTNCFILANAQIRGGKSARLVVLGDERQSIYRHQGADSRFLTLAPDLFGPVSPYPFAKSPLSQSFRLSMQSTQFINQAFLNEPYITSSKTGPKPIVLQCDPFRSRALASKLIPLIRRYGPSNCAILAPSVDKDGPHKDLANILVENYNVPICQPLGDEARPQKKVTHGKLCVSSIHSFKGSERNLIILFKVDESFFRFFGRDLPDDRCPNETFVALTRAAEQLVLIHSHKDKLMPFMSVEALYETADVMNLTGSEAKISPGPAPGRPLELELDLPDRIGVTDMVRHMQDEVVESIVSREVNIEQLSPPLPDVEHIKLRSVVPTDTEKKLFEHVSDINGLVVVAAFEHSLTGNIKTLDLDGGSRAIPSITSKEAISWLCREACQYQARRSGYKARSFQMKNHAFDWIDPEAIALAQSRLREQFGDVDANVEFEKASEVELDIDDQRINLLGQIDIVTRSSTAEKCVKSIWEIKFVSQLSKEHIIQACAYAYMVTPENGELPRIILYNVKDGEKLEITARNGREGLRGMIESVLRNKYTAKEEMSDDEFLEMCEKTRLEVLNLQGP